MDGGRELRRHAFAALAIAGQSGQGYREASQLATSSVIPPRRGGRSRGAKRPAIGWGLREMRASGAPPGSGRDSQPNRAVPPALKEHAGPAPARARSAATHPLAARARRGRAPQLRLRPAPRREAVGLTRPRRMLCHTSPKGRSIAVSEANSDRVGDFPSARALAEVAPPGLASRDHPPLRGGIPFTPAR
jgi:hypothetical protein